jgi:hypothetical protein
MKIIVYFFIYIPYIFNRQFLLAADWVCVNTHQTSPLV